MATDANIFLVDGVQTSEPPRLLFKIRPMDGESFHMWREVPDVVRYTCIEEAHGYEAWGPPPQLPGIRNRKKIAGSGSSRQPQ